MSLASVYATEILAKDAELQGLEARVPPSWSGTSGSGLVASVTRAGGLLLNREATLTSEEALSIRDWLTQTYDVPA